jgi:hypothetical protein
MKNKKGFDLAISTLILLVLGIFVLIGFILILTMGWGNFKEMVFGISGSEMANAQKVCELQCDLDNKYDFCCVNKTIESKGYSCDSEDLKGNCQINCEGVCNG